MLENVFKETDGAPNVVQSWTFSINWFLAADERLSRDLADVRETETKGVAFFAHATTLN